MLFCLFVLLLMNSMDDYCDLFVLYKQYPSGGKIWLMLGTEQDRSDYNDIMAVAECFAAKGHEVKVLHAVHYRDSLYREVFGDLIGTKYYRKCPDLMIDDTFVEYESYRTDQPKKALKNMLHNGLAQSDSLILRHCNLTDGYIRQQIRGQEQKGVAVSSVWLFDGKEIRLLYNTEG